MEVEKDCEDLFDCFEQKAVFDSSNSLNKRKRKHNEKNESIEEIKMESFDTATNDPSTSEIIYPEVVTNELFSGLGCTHEVAVPIGIEAPDLPDSLENPAKEYPFVLDDFQKRAITCISSGQSVLVSAHTSSGKTAIAEYAIAQCLSRHQRVVYTSPIKALSNQKYRELSAEFADVGLQTGDVTLNPTASCVIMTTEILRSMLYRGSELLREVAWVIFDEIHYMRDRERGVVWEESIVMLPDAVRYVFLSATIPNASQFAQWVAATHSQVCHVVSTEMRPVPLQHYVYSSNERRLYLVLDADGSFKSDHLRQAIGDHEASNSRINVSSVVNELKGLVRFMSSRQFFPVLIFSFSKRECEHYATSLADARFNDDKETALVDEVFFNAIASLSEEDRTLPQIDSALGYLRRGIGIHHSGLLPLLKEITEILFSEGLVKFLFATETFAMGLNMPARTVVFTSVQKFDGQTTRWLQSGEYIQMSGRAGRRGIDERGVCILMPDPGADRDTVKKILSGPASALTSAFRLTYNMILNLLRIEGADPEYMMRKSFFQFQLSTNVPNISAEITRLKLERDTLSVSESSKMLAYARLLREEEIMRKEASKKLLSPNVIRPFIAPGRLVFIRTTSREFGWGCILSRPIFSDRKPSPSDTVDVLLNVSIRKDKSYEPCSKGELCPSIVPVAFDAIAEISAVRIYLPESLTTPDSKLSVLNSIKKIETKFKGSLPLLDPVKDLKLSDKDSIKFFETLNKLQDRLAAHPCAAKLSRNSTKPKKVLKLCKKYLNYTDDITNLETELQQIHSIVQLNDLRARKRVLRRLGFINASDMIEVKGRVACEISSADELVLTELIFNGFFNDITHRNVCAVLSCFLFQEKSESAELSEENRKLFAQVIKTATHVHKIAVACSLVAEDNQEYLNNFNKDLMEVFSRWADGSSFKDILTLSSVFEGSIIRCLRRLEELLKELISACKCIGNADLEKKFRECSHKIKRNIAFSASLYL